jgi:aminomethyltransferase
VRERAGLFDVSHMGEVDVRGADALALVQHVTTNDASTLDVGQAQYTVLCGDDGGVLDDCLVYRFADRYMIVVNAANRAKDYGWIAKHARDFEVEVDDVSDEIALLAVQGPRAQEIVSHVTDADLDSIAYYHFAEGDVNGAPAVISRTGYTGEDGFELYVPEPDAAELWSALLEHGRDAGLVPIGLGARDSLRLEMGYALYGNDLDENHTPLEAGLGWVVKMKKGEFLGRDALARQKEAGVRERLVGFQLEERGFPRHGYIARFEGEPAGEVTSGILSPTLGKGIGLAYVTAEAGAADSAIEIMIRDKAHAAKVTRPPFYRDGSIRR